MINEQIGPREDYSNLQITITRADGTRRKTGNPRYNVFFEISRWRYFDPSMVTLNLNKLLELASDPQEYGKALGKAFFSKVLGQQYGESLAAVQGRGDGLRVRMVIEPPELQEIFWERIYHPIAGEWRPLGSTAVTPFSRFVKPQEWDRPIPVMDRPLKVLAVIASPANLDNDFSLDPIDPEECLWLHQVLDQIPDFAVTYLESGTANKPTLNEIRKRLANGYDLIHFLCHGAHTPAGTGLFLEAEDGNVDPVNQDRLVEAFKVLKKPPVLAFLGACESAKRDRHDAMLPLGPALVEDGGVQAVVAMTDKVGLRVSQVFASQFYTRLLKHGVVDLAVNEARALVQDDWDWGVPVLFSRLEDNQLIDFPIGKAGEAVIARTGLAAEAIDEAIRNARVEEHGQQLLRDLRELLDELNKSNGLQVDITSRFRRTGRDPQDFAKNFEAFYYDFKDIYYNQTWTKETTSCGRIGELKSRVLPKLSPLLSDQNFDQLRKELDLLSNADTDIVRTFREYMDTMNSVVEAIWAKLDSGDVEGAIQEKREFEQQIDPSFKRTQALFDRMSQHYEAARAA